MNTFEPTPEQQNLIEHSGSNLFVTAVPGAGKTATMAQRFARLTGTTSYSDRRGVAVLSFTNAAATEIEERARNVGGDLTPPNFIGTIDSFLRRFLVVPYIKSRLNVVPDIRDEWGDFGDLAKFQIPKGIFNNNIQEASLAEISFPNSKVNYDLRKRGGFFQSRIPKQTGHEIVVNQAEQRQQQLNQTGYFDAYSARMLALRILDENLYQLTDILASRFREVILDEVQDCNATDLMLLEELCEKGVQLTLIGDLDQDIYGFRGSDAEKVREFCSERAFESIAIKRNFRSTPEICEFVSALRRNNTIKDQPVRKSSGVPLKIFSYSKLDTVSDLRDALDSSSSTGEQSTILASTHAVLAEASQRENKKSVKTITKTKRMITGIAMLLDSYSEPSQRKKAVNHIERGIVENCKFDNGNEIQNRQMLEDHLAAKGGSLNLVALDITFAVKNLLKTENPRVAVKDQIEKTLRKWGLSVKARARIVPNNNEWDGSFPQTRSSPKTNTETIHGSKGMQYDRVIVVLDKMRASPKHQTHAENLLTPKKMEELATAQRLFYVAASRARNELILAVDQGLKEKLERFLSDNAVEFEHINLPIDH
ncbi:ATP-dependent helicase [Corynebacterium diphtheriae]|nr:ATP-dependent helicase [Corynebacterium diphtheriae]CAB0742951.1 ATP-dependent helicase [Corynebacterium diphtheriae]CAB0763143.1 ATP-dependent helicase [Corynebacterium diphtheriae]CAB0763253.1 ATP-dependent helicase [Corynebacterium diphtheriae]CAB1049171.1 ATP-dependent helicase [Corynebacterium diphtheriae]